MTNETQTVKDEPRLKNYRTAAAYLSLSEREVWRMGKEGNIPTIRIGRSVRFDVRDLDEWIEKQKGTSK